MPLSGHCLVRLTGSRGVELMAILIVCFLAVYGFSVQSLSNDKRFVYLCPVQDAVPLRLYGVRVFNGRTFSVFAR